MSLHKQLQDQISSLESRSRKLKDSIKEKENELKTLSMQYSKPIRTLDTVLQEIESLDNCLNEDIGLARTESSQKRIYDSMKEVKIRFAPTESFSNLYIMGDFNKWEPSPLKRVKDSFVYTATLLKNFKYYYIFSSSNDPFLIDLNSPHELNFSNSQLNNYISIGENAEPFNYKSDYHLLEEAYKNYKDLNIDSSDLILLQSVRKVTDSSQDFCNGVLKSKEKKMKIIQTLFEEKEVICPQQKKIEKIFKLFIGRVLKIKNSLYICLKINVEAGYLSCMKLYDDNGISIDYEFYRCNGLYIKYPFKNFLAETESSDRLDYSLLNELSSKETLAKFNEFPKRLTVFYRLFTVSQTNPLAIMKIGFVHVRKQLEVEILKVQNEDGVELSLEDYNIEITDSMISSIKSKAENTRVLYILKEVKEAKAEPLLEFMTSIVNKKLKLLHCKSLKEFPELDFNTLCVVEEDLGSGSAIEKIKHLKVTIKSNKISKVVLKKENLEESEVPFLETKFSPNQLVLVKGSIVNYLINSIARIFKISELISGHFTSNSFTLSELRRNVGVQVEVMFDCKWKYCNYMLTLPTIDNLMVLGMKDEERFNQMLDHQFQFEDYNEIALLGKLHSLCIEASESFSSEKIKELSEANAKFLPKIQEYLQANECWNRLEDLDFISSFFDNA